jgi:hypothetical protein
MTTHNPENERIKRQYFAYLADAEGYSEQSIRVGAGIQACPCRTAQ